MGQSNTKIEQQMEWRRNKVNELSIKGYSQADIARTLNISKSTISRDIEYLKEEARDTIRNHIQEKLPYEFNKCIQGLENIIREAYSIAENGNTKDKLQSLSLIKDTYNTKMDLLTNSSLLQDSIKFVEQNKGNLRNCSAIPEVSYGVKSNTKKVLDNDIQGSTEDNSDQSTEQFNQIF